MIKVVRCYQFILSPWVGQSCRFTPTCSQYMIDAISECGPFHGIWLGIKRVCRCNPWCNGGHDPVKPLKK